MIKPTVGRVVWYWPHVNDADAGPHPGDQPLAAHVAHVHNDTSVNLMVIGKNGVAFPKLNVSLWHGEESKQLRPDVGFAEWPVRNDGGRDEAVRDERNRGQIAGRNDVVREKAAMDERTNPGFTHSNR